MSKKSPKLPPGWKANVPLEVQRKAQQEWNKHYRKTQEEFPSLPMIAYEGEGNTVIGAPGEIKSPPRLNYLGEPVDESPAKQLPNPDWINAPNENTNDLLVYKNVRNFPRLKLCTKCKQPDTKLITHALDGNFFEVLITCPHKTVAVKKELCESSGFTTEAEILSLAIERWNDGV